MNDIKTLCHTNIITGTCTCRSPKCLAFKPSERPPRQEECIKMWCCPCSVCPPCPPCQCQRDDTVAGTIQARLEKANPITIDHEQAILFDKIVTRTSKDISYDPKTGRFCLRAAGTYLIHWDVSVEGSSQSSSIRFALLANDQVKGDSTLPVSVGQLSGTCLVKVNNCATIVKLINYTEDTVQLSRFLPVANLTIARIEK